MKILVVSDIHAFVRPRENGVKPSYVHTGDQSDMAPTVSFETLLRNETIPKPDIVVSPGDLGDQADSTSINFAWSFLNRLADLSSKKLLLASTGNHDIDSRYQDSEFDAKGALLNLRPSYPTVNLNGDSSQDKG